MNETSLTQLFFRREMIITTIFCCTINGSCVRLPWSYGPDLEARQLLYQGQCGDVRDPLVTLDCQT